jgi:hypothetical protein
MPNERRAFGGAASRLREALKELKAGIKSSVEQEEPIY